jgi:hypothetical protein
MTKATPDQIRVFRHRRLFVILASVGILVAGFILMASLMSLKMVHQNIVAVLFVGIGTVLLMCLGGAMIQRTYFRCPICSRRIPSVGYIDGVALGSRCKSCDVDFAA